MKLGQLLDKVYFNLSVRIILQDTYINFINTKLKTIYETNSFEYYGNSKYDSYNVRGVSVEDSTLVIYIQKGEDEENVK